MIPRVSHLRDKRFCSLGLLCEQDTFFVPIRAFCGVGKLGPAILAKALQGVVFTDWSDNIFRPFQSRPCFTGTKTNQSFHTIHQVLLTLSIIFTFHDRYHPPKLKSSSVSLTLPPISRH
jgi:hypothetical protein